MRWMRGPAVLLLICLLGSDSVRGDEPKTPVRDKRSAALSDLVAALRLKLEARLEEGRIYRRAGRDEEALEAFRSVHDIYAEGLKEIRALLDLHDTREVRLTPAKPPGSAPPVVLVKEEPETHEQVERGLAAVGGGAFRERVGGTKRPGSGRERGYADAVDDALRWLAAHQSPNGRWEAAGFGAWCDGKTRADPSLQAKGRGQRVYDVGVTGLALCAFLGAGYTHRGKHPFAATVSRGLRYLKAVQDREGCFGGRTHQHYIYNHATAALAMVEAYGMTGSRLWMEPAQRCLLFGWEARNPYFAWRYGVKSGDCDTSVSGWMTMVHNSAVVINRTAVNAGRQTPLMIDRLAFDGMRAWLDKMTDPDYGRVGYINRGGSSSRSEELLDDFPGDAAEAMTAVGILSRIALGDNPRRTEIIKLGAELCVKRVPEWNPKSGAIDMYYWYHGTLAMFQVGGRYWKAWEAGLRSAVLPSQRMDTDYCLVKGSWDPIGSWGPDGGRVYSTALMAMCCEVQTRYARAFGAK